MYPTSIIHSVGLNCIIYFVKKGVSPSPHKREVSFATCIQVDMVASKAAEIGKHKEFPETPNAMDAQRRRLEYAEMVQEREKNAQEAVCPSHKAPPAYRILMQLHDSPWDTPHESTTQQPCSHITSRFEPR